MREFAAARSRVRGLSLPARVLYTAFAVLTELGIISSVWLYVRVVDFAARSTPRELLQNVVEHYRAPPQGSADLQRVLEVTHAHLFTMPVLLLVAGHLLLLTALDDRAKAWLLGFAITASTVHVLVPLATWLGGPSVAWLYPLSGVGLFVSLTLLLAIPVREMWTGGERAEPER